MGGNSAGRDGNVLSGGGWGGEGGGVQDAAKRRWEGEGKDGSESAVGVGGLPFPSPLPSALHPCGDSPRWAICVRERERERGREGEREGERDREKVCMYVCMCVCMYV